MYSGDKKPEEIRELERIRLKDFKKQQQKTTLRKCRRRWTRPPRINPRHLKDMLGDVSKGSKGGGKGGPRRPL